MHRWWNHAHNFTGTLDGLTLLDKTIRTEEHDTDLASLEVHAHALDARSEPVYDQLPVEAARRG